MKKYVCRESDEILCVCRLQYLNERKSITLNANSSDYGGVPYVFGIDPVCSVITAVSFFV